jgi:hypothetical protein
MWRRKEKCDLASIMPARLQMVEREHFMQKYLSFRQHEIIVPAKQEQV